MAGRGRGVIDLNFTASADIEDDGAAAGDAPNILVHVRGRGAIDLNLDTPEDDEDGDAAAGGGDEGRGAVDNGAHGGREDEDNGDVCDTGHGDLPPTHSSIRSL